MIKPLVASALVGAAFFSYTTAALGQSPLDDNFNGNAINPHLWTVAIYPSNVGTIIEANQRLEMIDALAGNSYQGLQGRCKLRGDFDAQVDFALLNWPAANFHTVRFSAPDLPSGPFGVVGIYRNSYQDENYQFRTGTGVFSDVPVSDTSDTMRLIRTGSTISAYYLKGGAFVSLGSVPTGSGDTGLTLDFSTPSNTAPANVAIAFDNFKVNKGVPVCPADGGPSPSFEYITNYQLTGQQAAGGNRVVLTYRADLVNALGQPLPPGMSMVAATLTNLDPFTTRVVPGQDKLLFSGVTSNSETPSANTFSVIVDPAVPFDTSKLQWTFQNGPAPLISIPVRIRRYGWGVW